MGFITTVNHAEALLQQKNQTGRTPCKSGVNFLNTLKGEIQGAAENMSGIFKEAAARYHVPAQLLTAVAKAESNFNPRAVSHAGAIGVMQLMPGTAKSLGVSDPYDARESIMGGARYLRENLDRFGSVELALAAYNAGPDRVTTYGGVPPFAETQNYVKTVMSNMSAPGLKADTTAAGAVRSPLKLSYAGGERADSLPVTGGLPAGQGGDFAVMDKESVACLIQMLRLKMMEADREVGVISV